MYIIHREEEEVLQSHYIMTYTIKDGVRRTKYQLTNEVQFLYPNMYTATPLHTKLQTRSNYNRFGITKYIYKHILT